MSQTSKPRFLVGSKDPSLVKLDKVLTKELSSVRTAMIIKTQLQSSIKNNCKALVQTEAAEIDKLETRGA